MSLLWATLLGLCLFGTPTSMFSKSSNTEFINNIPISVYAIKRELQRQGFAVLYNIGAYWKRKKVKPQEKTFYRLLFLHATKVRNKEKMTAQLRRPWSKPKLKPHGNAQSLKHSTLKGLSHTHSPICFHEMLWLERGINKPYYYHNFNNIHFFFYFATNYSVGGSPEKKACHEQFYNDIN